MKVISLKFENKSDVPEALRGLYDESSKEVRVIKASDAERVVEGNKKVLGESKTYGRRLEVLKSLLEKLGVDVGDMSNLDQEEYVEKLTESLEAYKEAKEKLENVDLSQMENAAEVEEKIKARMEKAREHFEAQIAKKQELLQESEKQISALKDNLASAALTQQISLLYQDQDLGLNPQAMNVVTDLAAKVFRYDHETGEFTAKDARGEPLLNSTGDGTLDFKEWASTVLHESSPFVFLGNTGADAKGAVGARKERIDTSNMSEDELWSVAGV